MITQYNYLAPGNGPYTDSSLTKTTMPLQKKDKYDVYFFMSVLNERDYESDESFCTYSTICKTARNYLFILTRCTTRNRSH